MNAGSAGVLGVSALVEVHVVIVLDEVQGGFRVQSEDVVSSEVHQGDSVLGEVLDDSVEVLEG